jgi:LCP family protein required for cell wall assembly
LAALHAGGDDGELNADTLILVHLATAPRQPPVAVSIPRDSYVTVPGFGPHKINSALQRAMLAAKSTLIAQGLSGAGLDRLAQQAGRQKLEINLAGFYEIAQAVGGVPVCLTAPVHDSYSGADFPAGPQTVSGAAALAFVRQRYGLPRGDLDRIQRQQAYLSGLAHQLLSAHLLTDPAAVAALRQAITRYVVIDPGWDLAGLLDQAASLQAAAIQFRTIPTGRIDLPTPDGQAVQVDPEQVHQFIAQLINRTDRLPQPPSTTAPAVAPLASSFPCVS